MSRRLVYLGCTSMSDHTNSLDYSVVGVSIIAYNYNMIKVSLDCIVFEIYRHSVFSSNA